MSLKDSIKNAVDRGQEKYSTTNQKYLDKIKAEREIYQQELQKFLNRILESLEKDIENAVSLGRSDVIIYEIEESKFTNDHKSKFQYTITQFQQGDIIVRQNTESRHEYGEDEYGSGQGYYVDYIQLVINLKENDLL